MNNVTIHCNREHGSISCPHGQIHPLIHTSLYNGYAFSNYEMDNFICQWHHACI